jgi:hypothetical protein
LLGAAVPLVVFQVACCLKLVQRSQAEPAACPLLLVEVVPELAVLLPLLPVPVRLMVLMEARFTLPAEKAPSAGASTLVLVLGVPWEVGA